MKPSNQYTTPEQRFFVPQVGEIEYHESFDATELPTIEKLPDGDSYAIVVDKDGNQDPVGHWGAYWVDSGSVLKAVVVVAPGEQNPTITPDINLDYMAHRGPMKQAGVYKPQADDKLIVRVSSVGLHPDTELYSRVDDNHTVIIPANEPLPYQDGSNQRSARFRIIGAIKPDLTLVSWPGVYGHNIGQRQLDRAIVHANTANWLERALLDFDLRGSSLVGGMQNCEALKAYVRYYDGVRGTNYLPQDEPRDHMGTVSEEAYPEAAAARYEFLMDINYKLLNRQISRD